MQKGLKTDTGATSTIKNDLNKDEDIIVVSNGEVVRFIILICISNIQRLYAILCVDKIHLI